MKPFYSLRTTERHPCPVNMRGYTLPCPRSYPNRPALRSPNSLPILVREPLPWADLRLDDSILEKVLEVHNVAASVLTASGVRQDDPSDQLLDDDPL